MADVKIKLTSAQVRRIKDRLRQLDEVIKAIDRLEYCGGECSAFREQAAYSQEQLVRLQEGFSP